MNCNTQQNENEHNDAKYVVLNVIYAECRNLAYYAECRYAECRGA